MVCVSERRVSESPLYQPQAFDVELQIQVRSYRSTEAED